MKVNLPKVSSGSCVVVRITEEVQPASIKYLGQEECKKQTKKKKTATNLNGVLCYIRPNLN